MRPDLRIEENSRKLNIASAAVCAVLAVSYFVVLYRYVTDIPLWDDYYDILYFFKTYLEADGFLDKFSTLLWRYTEHRTLPGRLIYLAYYYTFGQLNFFWMSMAGLVIYLLLAWIVGQLPQRQQTSTTNAITPAHIVPFALLLSMGAWMGSYSTMNSISMVSFVVLFFAVFLLLKQQTTNTLLLAMVLNVLIVTVGLMGFLNLLFTTFYALSSNRPMQQKKIWGVFFLLASMVFFVTYSDYLQTVEYSREDTLRVIVNNPGRFTLLGFAFIGGFPFADGDPLWAGAVVGVWWIVASVYLLWRCWQRDREYFYLLSSALGFMYALMVACCVGRYLYMQESIAYISRYKHYQAILLSLILIGYMQLYPCSRVSIGAVILALAATVSGYIRFLPQIEDLSSTAQERISRWAADGSYDSLGIIGVAPYSDQILFWAIDKGLYNPYRESRTILHQHQPPRTLPRCGMEGQSFVAMDAFVLSEPSSLGARVMLFNRDAQLHISSLYLCSEQANYQLDAREAVSEMAVQKALLAPGQYRLGFVTTKGEHFALNQTLTVPRQREKHACTTPDDGGPTVRFSLEVKRAFCDQPVSRE